MKWLLFGFVLWITLRGRFNDYAQLATQTRAAAAPATVH